MLKHIIFDFDGTIADTHKIAYDVYLNIAKDNKLPIVDEKTYRQLSKLPIRKRIKRLRVPLFKIPKFIRQAKPLFHQGMVDAPIFDEITQLIKKLSQTKIKLYILSSNTVENIESFLISHQLPYFDDIIGTVSLFGKAKALKKFMKKHRMSKTSVLYVGDEERDIRACQQLGIRIAAVTWGYDHRDLIEQAKPNFIIEEVLSLYDLVIELSQEVSND